MTINRVWISLAIFSLLLSVAIALGEAAPPVANNAGGASESEPRSLLREGMQLVDTVGEFRTTGDRLAFYYDEGQRSITCLENLGLERVSKMISERTGPLQWVVTGQVTEFRQVNYLLLKRATLQRRAASQGNRHAANDSRRSA